MKITAIILGLLTMLLLVSTVVLAVLFFKSNSELGELKQNLGMESDEAEVSDSSDIETEDTEDSAVVTTANFVDIGLDINIEYPSDWEWVLETDISDDFASGGAFKEIHNYNLDFTKGANSIHFAAIFGGVGDIGVQYPADMYDTEVLNSDLIRVRENGQVEWRYLSKIPCTDAIEWDGVTEVCGAGGFFPGFATGGASSVVYSGTDALLDEVDAIVLTAQN